MEAKFTSGPWEYVPSNEFHGPYVTTGFGDVADCYAMSNPSAASVRNGGTSYPVHHQGDDADANARLIAAAPELYAELHSQVRNCPMCRGDGETVETFDHVMGFIEPGKKVDCHRCKSARSILAKARGEAL